MSRTSFLVAIAVAVLLMQLFPTHAGTIKWVAIVIGVLYLLARALRTYPKQYRDRKRRAAQDAADETQYRVYEAELDSIRAEYDPRRELGDPNALPPAYRDKLSALHAKHKAMLARKFGA